MANIDIPQLLNNFTLTNKKSSTTYHYRFNYIFNFASIFGTIAHTAFIFLFILLGIKEMALFNIFSSLTWYLVFRFQKVSYPKIAYVLGYSELIVHAVLATYYLGWNSGFHYFIFSTVIVLFYMPHFKKRIKITLSILSAVLYISLYFFSHNSFPVYEIRADILNYILGMNIIITFFIFSFLSHFYNNAANKAEDNLQESNNKLRVMATTDHLTGLLNRRCMINNIEYAIQKYHNSGETFSVIMADIDDFKKINDLYGHDCGDKVLVSIATLLQENLRKNDLIARWGGEEFLILLRGINSKEAEIVANKLKESINTASFTCIDKNTTITMTYGINQFEEDLDSCINNSDRALYQGKERGKNCVIVYNE